MVFLITLALLCGSMCHSCYGNLPEPARQLVVLKDIPSSYTQNPPVHFNIRSNFKGSVEFVKSDKFSIHLDINSPSTDDLARVHYNYTTYDSSVLLQVFEADPPVIVSPIRFMLMGIGGATGFVFLCTLIFVCWWNINKRPYIKDTKIMNHDSIHAPLLDGRQAGDPQGANGRVKKRKKKKSRHMNEEYVSSEEDTLDRRSTTTTLDRKSMNTTLDRRSVNTTLDRRQQYPNRGTLSPQRQVTVTPKISGASSGPTRASNDTLNSSGSTYHPMTNSQDLPPPPSHPQGGDKPVVSYIKIQGQGPPQGQTDTLKKKQGSHYIPLNQSEGSGSDVEKQTTLKIRDSEQMPDVVKRGSNANPPGVDITPRQQPNTRYIPLNDTTDNDNLSKLSGAHIAHILGDHGSKSSPKFTHNSDRIPTTFTAHREQDLDRVELDSVGSSRSAASSRSSGMRTASGSGGTGHLSSISDTDSARSSGTGSTGTFPRAPHKDPSQTNRYFLTLQGGRQNGHSPPNTDHGSDSSSPRLVDEAYGTMGSNGSSTIRSSSTASTGSGSSGIVVTVIQNEDSMGTFGRRKPPRRYGGEDPQGVPGSQTLPRHYGQGGGPGQGGGGGTYPGSGPHKYLHMSVVCSLCIISLISGVYSARMVTETEVHIKIFAPPGFIRNRTAIYNMKDKEMKVETDYPLQVWQYKVEDAYIRIGEEVRCRKPCKQGCDIMTGNCLCHTGYRLTDGIHCDDVNECITREAECNPYAQCFNRKGSYDCICAQGYYGDGKHCQACDSPCGNGTFEVLPCADGQPKLCRECSKSCVKGYYISAPCDATRNIQCSVCSPECKTSKYEYTPCHGLQNRQCHDLSDLPRPRVSGNLLLENRKRVKQVFSYLLHQTQTTGPLTHMVELKRGTDFSVHVTLKESNLAPLYDAVDHSDSNDNEGYYGDVAVTQKYCPYPIPEKYQLSMALHQGITTKAQYYHCDKKRRRSSKSCTHETGYYLNPQEPCETYSQFGRLPNMNPDGWSVVCTKPGVLADVFGVSNELTDVSTMFVDKTVSCAEKRTSCDGCSVNCARNMQSYRGSHRCNITGEDSDNGESPRLSHCLSCCAKQDCSKTCEVYHNPDCEPLRCVTGNVAEFVLQPSYANRNSVFGCHIGPKKNYKIYDLEYKVTYKDKTIVNNRKLKAQKIYDGVHPDKAIDKHDFLKVYYGSEVKSNADFIEGDSTMKSFTAGYYQASGTPVSEANVKTRSLPVRPREPFLVSTKKWKTEPCDTSLLSDLLLISNSPQSDPYKPDPAFTVQYVSNGEYRIFNRTSVPFIYFEVPMNESILRAVYDDTTVKDDSTLKAEIIREPTRWVLSINGEMEKCPGFMSVVVHDPGYPDEALFEYDVGVSCPKTFSMGFAIPTEGTDDYDKKLKVEIKDSFRSIRMMVFRPAPNVTEEKAEPVVTYDNQGEKEMTIFTPIIAVLCVVISFLGILLFVGFITESGKTLKKVDNKVHSQHLLFVVCYVTFRTAYSLAVTFTVLLLLINYVNKSDLNMMSEFPRYVESADNLQSLEVQKIQQFVTEELMRQNQMANQTKSVCEAKLHQLQNVLEETKQQLKVEDGEERLVSQVALQYTKLMVLNLTKDINKFKEKFSGYAQKALDRLTRSIVQTSSALQSNKWLAGAKAVYDVVSNKRSQQGQSTKPFMDWVGIRQEVERLTVDLSLKDFPMPNLTDFLNLKIPQTNNKATPIPSISETSLPRNQWYFQYESPGGDSDKGSGQSSGGQGRAPMRSPVMSWSSLLAILVIVDSLWFVHRMARTYSTAKMILYGCPCYIDCKKNGEGQPGQKMHTPHRSFTSRCMHYLKDLNLRVMRTEFVPKLVATATTCCAIYLILVVSDKTLTVKTLASVGYFDTMVAPVETSYRLARTRIKTNAYRINKFEYPFYEELVNVRTKRYQLMLEMYRDVQQRNNILHDSEYCAWKKMLNPDEKCNCTTAKTVKLHFEGCELPPVNAQPYERKDFSTYRRDLSKSMVPYINSARDVTMETCHLVLIFVSLLVLVDILGAVTWIYLKRFNLLRLKPLFEIEQYPEAAPS